MSRISFTFLTIVLALLNSILAETAICSQCKCENSTTTINFFKLDCSKQDLRKIPQEWPELPNNNNNNASTVISASFSGNNLTTLDRFPQSNATIELILTKCEIASLTSGLFQNIVNVRFVDFSYNLITGKELKNAFVGPLLNNTQFMNLAIEHLNLAYNQIHSIGKNIFKHMPNLKTLNLEGNQFRVLDLQTQASFLLLKQLERLNLANNQLTELVKNALTHLDNVHEVNLSKNLLNFVPFSLGTIGKTLQVLILDDNPIAELNDETFIGLEQLVEISANNLTELKYVNANTFAHLTKLKKLSLCNNYQLTDIDREAFPVNFSLSEFYLSNNNLYKIDYTLLVWSGLKVFNFTNNPLDCSCNLYNITKSLSVDITRNENGPYCLNPSTDQSEQVFYLKSDICTAVKKHVNPTKSLRGYTHLSIGLTGLILVLIFASALAMHMSFIKYKICLRNRNNIAPNLAYGRVPNVL